MKKIPDDLKERILEYAGENIVGIIGEYVELQRAHSSFQACCPFHAEKTPSFRVNVGRKRWHCFGSCGTGGDAVSFVMRAENISFPDALLRIARRGNIEIPRGETAEEKQRKAVTSVMGKAARYFQDMLRENRNGGKTYVESRFDSETVKEYGIGYAPGNGGLIDLLQREKIPLQLAEKAGLVKNDKGTWREYFWGRVMFPIRDRKGDVIAFAGRAIKPDAKPKYLNSPETILFRKRATLFGLDTAYEHIRATGEAFIVEGYTDRIQLKKQGVANTVATCGTALTKEHLAALRRLGVRHLNLMFDGDEAGRKALERAVTYAFQEDMPTTAYLLPAEEDPDSFFKSGRKLDEVKTLSGLEYLEATAKEGMTTTMRKLLRLERMERGMVYLAEQLPQVRLILRRRGNLEHLFEGDLLERIEELVNAS